MAFYCWRWPSLHSSMGDRERLPLERVDMRGRCSKWPSLLPSMGEKQWMSWYRQIRAVVKIVKLLLPLLAQYSRNNILYIFHNIHTVFIIVKSPLSLCGSIPVRNIPVIIISQLPMHPHFLPLSVLVLDIDHCLNLEMQPLSFSLHHIFCLP